jgi:hypothetical protein
MYHTLLLTQFPYRMLDKTFETPSFNEPIFKLSKTIDNVNNIMRLPSFIKHDITISVIRVTPTSIIPLPYYTLYQQRHIHLVAQLLNYRVSKPYL